MEMSREVEHEEKEARVHAYLRHKGLDGVLLTRQDNFAWITGGGCNYVGTATEAGVGTIFFTGNRRHLIANNIEAHRLFEEELGGTGYEVHTYPWHDDRQRQEVIRRLTNHMKVVSDDGVAGTRLVDPDFVELRYSLTDAEVERYRWLGPHCSQAMEEVCMGIVPGDAEHQIAGRICKAYLDFRIMPTVLLVAADDRIRRYRHPIFTDKKVEKCVMVVVCGRRWGLIVSHSRIVHFGPLSDDLKRRHQAVTHVDAAFILSSKPGVSVGHVLDAGIEAYRTTGYPDEWHHHHQGGPTGYAGREYRATPGERRQVQLHQAFAWNPTIAGTKSEDTIIAHSDRTEIVSQAQKWPTLVAEYAGQKIQRPDILVK